MTTPPFKVKFLLWVNQLLQKKETGELTPEFFRKSSKRKGALAKPFLTFAPINLPKVENRMISYDGREIPVRIYHPHPGKPLPVLVYFHGGGFVIGDLDSHDNICRRLAYLARCVVMAVDYRLAPEHPFPAAHEDAYAATCWAAAHPEELQALDGQLAVAGDSAGGNLAGAVALMAKEQNGPALKAQVLIYPVTDGSMSQPSYRENEKGYILEASTMEWFFSHYCPNPRDRLDPLLSLVRNKNLQGLPPAMILTAGFDPLRDEGEVYAQKLKDAGNKVVYQAFPTMIHTFFTFQRLFSEARIAMEQITRFLNEQWER